VASGPTDPREVLKPYLVGNVSAKGEQRMRCPIHKDSNPSASVNWKKNVWRCLGCGAQGSIRRLVADVRGGATRPGKARTRGPAPEGSGAPRAPLSGARVAGYHSYLMSSERLDYLTDERMLDEETIVKHKLGFDNSPRTKDHPGGKRYTIPVYDEDGILVNIRRYRSSKMQTQKMLNETVNGVGYGTPARLFPAVPPEATKVVLFEGEFDAMLGGQLLRDTDYVATTGTHGAGTWTKELSEPLRGKEVWVSYDNDDEGLKAAGKVAAALQGIAKMVYLVPVLSGQDKGDVTDWVRDEGGTTERLLAAIEAARPFGVMKPRVAEREVHDVKLSQTMDALPYPVRVEVTIAGQRDPTFIIPGKIHAVCDQDNGKRCESCGMSIQYHGETTYEIRRDDPKEVLRFLDISDDQRNLRIRRLLKAPTPSNCGRLEIDIEEEIPVEELQIMPTVDSEVGGDSDNTQRRAFSVGTHRTDLNSNAFLTGSVAPNPKTQRNEMVVWELEPSRTSLESFEMTPAKRKALEVFQVKRGQTPLSKMRDIAEDLSTNVTQIVGRERMHMAMDLVFHSLLHFKFEKKYISKGWVELLVAGDTRTGKSAAAIALSRHYQAGKVINCEGASLAGLIGGATKAPGGGDSWMIKMGELTRQDGRLAVMDEVSGAPLTLIGALSDVRSRGVAQITKIESKEFRCRVRLIFIGNERQNTSGVSGSPLGTELIKNLMGAPEDISRLDFAMTVKEDDVPLRTINSHNRQKIPHVYSQELCHELVMWAWSRKRDDVVFETGVEDYIAERAVELGEKYISDPPLIQGQSVREKIARLSVAMAARVFSCDSTGEKVVVKKMHVRDVVEFLDELYEYENFGYARTSRRVRRVQSLEPNDIWEAKLLLRSNPPALRFLIERNGTTFRVEDLVDMTGMDRGLASTFLADLNEFHMIIRQKSQTLYTPALIKLLKELEDG
jgi:hypothetical protein